MLHIVAHKRRKPPSMGHNLGHTYREFFYVRRGLFVAASNCEGQVRWTFLERTLKAVFQQQSISPKSDFPFLLCLRAVAIFMNVEAVAVSWKNTILPKACAACPSHCGDSKRF